MKQLILFFIILVTLQKLSARVIPNNEDRHVQNIDWDESERRPSRHRDQSHPIALGRNDFTEGQNIQGLNSGRRHQQHRNRIPENERVVPNSGSRGHSDDAEGLHSGRRHEQHRNRTPENERLVPNSGSRSHSDDAEGLNSGRRHQQHRNRIPENERVVPNSGSRGHSDDAEEESPVTRKSLTKEENSTVIDRFLINTGDNCNPGETRDTATNQCRPQIQ